MLSIEKFQAKLVSKIKKNCIEWVMNILLCGRQAPYLHWIFPILQFEISSLINWIFFPVWNQRIELKCIHVMILVLMFFTSFLKFHIFRKYGLFWRRKQIKKSQAKEPKKSLTFCQHSWFLNFTPIERIAIYINKLEGV